MNILLRFFSKSNGTILGVVIGLILVSATKSLAQEGEEEAFRPHHQLGLVLSHAHVFEGRDDNGKRSVLSLPSWGLDYNFFFHPKWGIGLHTDLIVEDFKVKKMYGDDEVIERSYPVAPAVMGIYKPGEHWSFLLGMGGEFAKEENFVLTRLGIEYGVELSRGWEIAGSFSSATRIRSKLICFLLPSFELFCWWSSTRGVSIV